MQPRLCFLPCGTWGLEVGPHACTTSPPSHRTLSADSLPLFLEKEGEPAVALPRSADLYPEATSSPHSLWAVSKKKKTWVTVQGSLSCSLGLELVPLIFRIQHTFGRFNFFTKQAEDTHGRDRNGSGCLLGSRLVAGCVTTGVLSLPAFPKVFLCLAKGSHPTFSFRV